MRLQPPTSCVPNSASHPALKLRRPVRQDARRGSGSHSFLRRNSFESKYLQRILGNRKSVVGWVGTAIASRQQGHDSTDC